MSLRGHHYRYRREGGPKHGGNAAVFLCSLLRASPFDLLLCCWNGLAGHHDVSGGSGIAWLLGLQDISKQVRREAR